MKFLKIILTIFLLSNLKEIKAQLPLSDATFSLTHTDAFNTSTLNPQWTTQYIWGSPVGGGLEYNVASNVILTYSSGYVALKTETTAPITYTPGPNSPYNYLSGMLYSTFTCKYGYFEISAKLPIGRGFWPAFWTFGGSTSAVCTNTYSDGPATYNEIDIMESDGQMSAGNYTTGCHYHWRDQSSCVRQWNWNDPSISGLPDLSQEHKYAVFWEPDRITHFIDDKEVLKVYDPVYTPQLPCGIIIALGLDPSLIWRPDGSTPFPSYMLINWFNAWQLLPDCNTPVSFCGNFNPATYVSKVKQSITIGGSGCSDNINTSSNINFWATDYVLLDEGTTITDNGSGSFMARVTLCPQ
jgi:beta-glucanase (GH16 family)